MLRLLALLVLPLLGVSGLLGELAPSGADVTALALLSIGAVAVDCIIGKRGKRSNFLLFALICLLLYSAQLALLLVRRLDRATSLNRHIAAGVVRGAAAAVGGAVPAAAPPATSALVPATALPTAATSAAVAAPAASVAPVAAAKGSAVVGFGGSLVARPARTISVVLPCAEERDNALNTVQRFCERTPDDQLAEIIVVDDGSVPPMTDIFAQDKRRLDQNPRCKLRILRHELTIGLMAAKLTGGKEARGDVIAFIDCHCAPQRDWHKEILAKVSENPRMMVVPAITDLDLDTFDEKANSQVNAKCYLTFDADFKWFDDESDFIPTISGGLVAMGRQWFNLTGGFDEEMHGWGGENLDQSLRAWLCGGEIARAKSSRIAHMWRTADPRTRTRYSVKAKGTDNRGRVAAAWFDEFLPIYRGSKLSRDSVRNFDAVKRRLGCKPFSYFLYRFRKVYIEGGVIAREVFQLRDKKTQLCLAHTGVTRAVRCVPGERSQRFQRGNVDRNTGRCCSGLRAYGTNDCMDYFDGSGGHYYSCDVSGQNQNQQARLLESGRIQREHGECLFVDDLRVAKQACSRLGPDLGIFEKVHVTEPQEWLIYKRELAKHHFAEDMPGLPDN